MQDITLDRKEHVAAVFGRAAPTYDQLGQFAFFGRRLVEATHLTPGAQVLDVAAGRGAVLFAAAERVGPEGHVIGIDISESMAEATATEIQRRRLSQAEIRTMDAEKLDFPPASFDAVICSFGAMFFPRLDRALSEFRRVLRPGGVVAISTWSISSSIWDGLRELRRRYGIEEGGLVINRLRQQEDVLSVLNQAGLASVEAWTDEAEFTFASEAEWWDAVWSEGMRAGLESLDPDVQSRFRAEAFQYLRESRQPGGFPDRRRAIFARGLNPRDPQTGSAQMIAEPP